MKLQLLLGVTLVAWAVAAVIVARRSPFRTYLRYVDALLFPLLVAGLVPPSVLAVDRLTPWMRELLALVPWPAFWAAVRPYEAWVGQVMAIGVTAVLFAAALLGWRRLIASREAARLERRASRAHRTMAAV